MTNFIFFPPANDEWENWVYFENAFSPEECDKVIEHAQEFEDEVAGVGDDRDENFEVRKSKIRWMKWNDNNDWIFRKFTSIVTGCNDARYGFDLTGFLEDLQFTQYFIDGHYQWHMDFGAGPFIKRKLSVVLQLTDPAKYEGGNLQFFDGYESTAPVGQGSVIVFPSFMQHRILPLTRGSRFSLVGWTNGPSFR